jgi:hypothetical protein
MSVANGMEFYKKKKIEGFKDCEDTIKFTVKVNIMFDAINRKFPAEGVKKNSTWRFFICYVYCVCVVACYSSVVHR